MKNEKKRPIWVITVAERYSGDETLSTIAFENEDAARREFREMKEEDAEMAESKNWNIEEDENSYESFEEGYESENHHIIKLEKVELQ